MEEIKKLNKDKESRKVISDLVIALESIKFIADATPEQEGDDIQSCEDRLGSNLNSWVNERKTTLEKLKSYDKQLQKITSDKTKLDKDRKETEAKNERLEKDLAISLQEKVKLKNQNTTLEKKLIEVTKDMRGVIKEAQNIPS